MAKMITVKRMPQTIQYDGKTYGPSEKPIRIPEELAAALGLPAVDGETPSATTEGDEGQAEELRAARVLAQQAQGNLNTLLELLAPAAQEGETPDQVLKRIVAERDTLEDEADTLRLGKNESQRAYQESMSVVNQLRGELEAKTREAQHAVEQWTATTEQHNTLKADLDKVKSERDALQKQVTDGKIIPADVRDRLIAVKGISDALADAAVAALTAPAKPAGK